MVNQKQIFAHEITYAQNTQILSQMFFFLIFWMQVYDWFDSKRQAAIMLWMTGGSHRIGL